MSEADIRKKKLLAKSLYNKRDYINASKIYAEICRDSPDAESHYMMSVLYWHSSNHALSAQHLTEALRLDPGNNAAWGQQGIVQSSQGNYEVAITSFKKALEINPKNAQVLINLGNAYRELGQLADAETCYKASLKLDKNNHIPLNNLANIYLVQCRYDMAEKLYKKAIKLNKDYFDAFYNLGATYQSKGDHKLALKYYKRAQKIRPEDINPQMAIANSYEKQGKFDKALEYLNPLLQKNIITPDAADIYSKICIKNKNYDDGISIIQKSLAMRINPINEQALRFCLGDIYDKKGLYDDAYEQYSTANSMRPYHYDKPASENAFSHIINCFKEIDSDPDTATSDNTTTMPIFIVGMPRSGTSLIEQILSSHSDVFGAGELPYMGEISEQYSGSSTEDLKYPDNVRVLNKANLNQMSDLYLSKLRQHDHKSNYITDKMPHNFMYVGLISMLFPQCKIIHCIRNPLDVCLSIFFHNFNQNHPYTDNLSNLGHYYNQYRRLMEFWNNQYDDLLIDIHYESVLSDAESNIRNMLEHIGVEWQDGCLKYYENKRTVSTPSYAQITQPLYKSSMERWRNYSSHVDALKLSIDDKYLGKL